MTESIEAIVERTKEGDRAAATLLVKHLQDDIYRLAMRMLGLRTEAEDATQEILLKVLTHLSEFRGESAFRTWAWRIAIRHLMRSRRGQREEIASFEMIEGLIARGDGLPVRPELPDGELAVYAEEVRLSCTQGMVLSLEREQRVSWILAEVFELSSEDAALVLEVEPSAHRKRLSRARAKLGEWMGKHCGLAREENPCRCTRQVPVAIAAGVVDPRAPIYAGHPARRSAHALAIVAEADEIEAAADAMRCHPDYVAPQAIVGRIRELITSGRYRVFDA